jgi:hypothetical protein
MNRNFRFGKTAEIAAYTRIENGEAPTNSINALVPEWWALEGLMVLEETLVVANLVNRDYNNYFVNAGDTVNINRPGTFDAKHKQRGVDTIIQDATASPDTVKLNQHIEVTFALDDREMQRSAVELRSYFLLPAVRAIAAGIDGAIVGEGVQFALNAVGQLGVALTDDVLIDLGRTFDNNNCPAYDRYLVVGPSAKADLLRIDRFADADKSGRSSALLTGQIGAAMGFDIFMSQTVGAQLVASTATNATLAINAATPKGATTIVANGNPAAIALQGAWLTIENVPGIYQIAVAGEDAGDTIGLSWPLKGAAAGGATITIYNASAAFDVTTNAAAGDIEVIIDDDITPIVGQGVSFGISSEVYTITRVEDANAGADYKITLNRPLDSAVTAGVDVNLMPTGGGYNLAFRPDAITLVNRPLTPAAAGVVATVQNNGAIALRVTIGYDQRKMMHAITVDTLLGVKVLDVNQGALLLN